MRLTATWIVLVLATAVTALGAEPKYLLERVDDAAVVQRIKSEGDYDAAHTLFETYGIHFDPKLRVEVLARVVKLDLPSYTGFVMPRLEPVKGPDGQITDVTISYPIDLTRQMLEYSANSPFHLESQP